MPSVGLFSVVALAISHGRIEHDCAGNSPRALNANDNYTRMASPGRRTFCSGRDPPYTG